MKSKRLLNVIGEIDDRYINEAAPSEKKQSKSVLIKITAVAAAFAIVLSSGVALFQHFKLPVLTISEFQYDAMGFEGYFAHNIDELKNNNPWNQNDEPKALPVYNNTLYRYIDDGIIREPDTDKMKDLLVETAASVGMDTNNFSVAENVPDGYPDVYSYYVENENYKIDVNAWMNVNIEFKKKDVLPDGYSMDKYASYDELQKTAGFLREKYAKLINMKKPTVDISLGDYDVNSNRLWNISFYEASDNPTQSIVNYNFNRIYFYADDEGNLSAASFACVDFKDKLGDYPIISAGEALNLLDNGKYITGVTEKFPGIENVKKVELVYRNTNLDAVFMPYYKFYVQLDSPNVSIGDTNLVCFGTYYVPAVESKYIKNLSQWDGCVN